MSSATINPPSAPIDVVLTRLAQRTGYEPIARERAGQWTADCPIRHADVNTLGVQVAKDGRVILLCSKGCSSNAIAAALDLSTKDLFPVPAHEVDTFQAEQSTPLRTRWRLDELLENDEIMRPPPPVVPRLAWAARSTLIAAREKAGKSTLTGYITACVSTGRAFLGDPTQQGDVLIIGLEEYIGDTARRLRDFGADATRVHLVDRFAGEPLLRPKELGAHIDAVAPVLVIIDSLTAYGHGQIQDDNNATQMAKVVQPLSDVVHQLGTALILIHHATKATGRSRGSTAITAGVDVVVEFEAPDDLVDIDPTLRRVRSVGRVPVPRQYDVRFEDNTYTLAEQGKVLPLDVRILAHVRDNPTSSQSKVRTAVGARSEEVSAMIGAMLADGRLQNHGTLNRLKLTVPDAIQTRFDHGAGQCA